MRSESDFRRQITYLAYKAWVEGRSFKRDNTHVTPVSIRLFGNLIMFRMQPSYHPEQPIYFSMCGWNTVTTRERLKITGIDISRQNGYGIAHNVLIGDPNTLYPTFENYCLSTTGIYKYIEATSRLRCTTVHERFEVLKEIDFLENRYNMERR